MRGRSQRIAVAYQTAFSLSFFVEYLTEEWDFQHDSAAIHSNREV